MRRYLVLGFLILGCASTKVSPVSPSATPSPASTAASSSTTPTITKTSPESERQVLTAVPPAPGECRTYLGSAANAASVCGDRKAALAALDKALGESDSLARDAALAPLEGCKQFELGLVLALRVESAPAACGDVLVGGYAEHNKARLAPAIYDALTGLELAAQLARLVRTPPQVDKPHTKEHIDAFVRGVMAKWATEQANAISALSLKGARLGGYGKGLVAVEAGMADMRFVEVFRQVPIPQEFASDPELAEAYYSALDQGLEPRKARGRDAALVGLRVFSDVGVLNDARVVRARALLSQLFNGRRIDALDHLLLPPLAAPTLPNEEHRLAARLPTFYVDFVLGAVDPGDTSVLRALLERGLPASLQGKLERSVLSAESRQLLARALFERGRTYWRSTDFASAATMATTRQPGPEEAKFVAALSHALEKGPNDAAAMMLGSTSLSELGDSSQLDSLAKGKSAMAALAAYDSAVIKELGAPVDSKADFFRDLAARYEHAAAMFKDPAQKKQARERAMAATETAKKLH